MAYSKRCCLGSIIRSTAQRRVETKRDLMVVGNNRNVRPVDVVNLYVLLLFCLCVVTVGVIWHSLAVPGALISTTGVSSIPIIKSVRVASKSKADTAQEVRRKATDAAATTDETTTTAADLLLGIPYEPYPLELFHVGPSTVHGRGLFASVFLPHGTFTGVQWVEKNIQYVLRGSNMTRRDLGIQHFQFDTRNDCQFPQQQRASMTNAELLPCFSRVLNSDCHTPSTEFVRYPWRDAHTHLIYSRTTRDLQPGDELTYDYRTAPEYTQQKEEWFVGCPPVKGGFATLDISSLYHKP